MPTKQVIERSIHDSLQKSFRALMARHPKTEMLYVYFPQENKGVVLHKNWEYDKWVIEATKEITVKINSKKEMGK